MKLKFRNFEFPVNPSDIEISSSSNCVSRAVLGKNSNVQNLSVNPVTVTGSGAFYGDNGGEYCAMLQNMLKDKSSGWLLIPSAPPVKAFFTKFTFNKNCKKNCVQYSFAFTEDCTQRAAEKAFTCTVAKEGENAFDIAYRYSVTVDDIMRLNDIRTPFDIAEGSRVIIR